MRGGRAFQTEEAGDVQVWGWPCMLRSIVGKPVAVREECMVGMRENEAGEVLRSGGEWPCE